MTGRRHAPDSMPVMHLRRSADVRLALGALLLTAPLLTSCGFDLATDRVNNIAQGGTNRDATVDVLNAVVVSAEEGSGVLVTTLSNNDVEEAGSLEAVTVDDAAQAEIGEFSPIEVAPGGVVNLASPDEEPIPVEGEGIAPGASIPMTFELTGGQVVRLDVPVVPNCDEFAGIDGTGGECELPEPVGEH